MLYHAAFQNALNPYCEHILNGIKLINRITLHYEILD